MCRKTLRAALNEQMKRKYHLRAQVVDFEPKQRAYSQPKVPPAARPPIFMADMAGGLASGSASELKIDSTPNVRRFPVAYCGELQTFIYILDLM
jgi:hypothetical protein